MGAALSFTGSTPDFRLAWIDRLRTVTIAGVVVAHAGTAYVIDYSWYYEERIASETIQLALLIPFTPVALFALGPLFFLGGLTAARSLARRGACGFSRSRLLRLGVPAVAYFLLIDPLADYIASRAQGDPRPLGQYLTDFRGVRDVGPFWFVVALLAFSLLYAGWRRLRPVVPAAGGAPLTWRTVLAVSVAGSLATGLVWLQWDLLAPEPWSIRLTQWPQSAAAFAVGVLIIERDLTLNRRMIRACGTVSLAGLVAFTVTALVGIHERPDGVIAMATAANAVLAALTGITAVTVSVWVVALFMRRWDRPLSASVRRAARGSYAAYFLHPVVLVVLSAAMRAVPWDPAAKFVVVAALGVPLVFIAGYLVTRLPGIGHIF